MGKIFILSIVGFGVFIAWLINGPLGDAEVPKLDENTHWGPKSKINEKPDASIRPFSIKIDEKVLTDLKNRLKVELSADGDFLTPPLEEVGFEYGFNSKFLKKVTNHWLLKYDWRAREALLNKYEHFKTKINGIDIHFQHIKPKTSKKYKNTRPLLLVHGWPGSFIEFQKVIPKLLEPENSDINFELVIPSLPGYGFSERSHRKGLDQVATAQIFHKLMKRLNYENYYVQGGDWGSLVVTHMAALYPNNVVAMHSNMCGSQHSRVHFRILIGALYPTLFMEEDEVTKMYPLSKFYSYIIEETGYAHIQATKPDTVGAALVNSPTGLAAYILEKFSTWTNSNWKNKEDGGLVSYYNLDDLLDNVMIYWVTHSITSSMRYYAEAFSPDNKIMNNVPVKVPTGCLFDPNDYFGAMTKFHLADKFPNIVHFTKSKEGGHFLAFEVPEIFSRDVVKFFNFIETNSTSKFAK